MWVACYVKGKLLINYMKRNFFWKTSTYLHTYLLINIDKYISVHSYVNIRIKTFFNKKTPT